MKKIFTLFALSIFAMTLTSCSKKTSNANDSSSLEPEWVIPEEKEEDKAKLSAFNYALKTSNPTKIVTNITYFYQKEEIILTYNSVLKISYGPEIKSSYNYTYQQLNELTNGSDEMISTYSGTIYTKSSSVGELLSDGTIGWVNSTQGSLSLFKFKLNGVFMSDYSVTENMLEASFNELGVMSMFENKNYTGLISDSKMEMIINENKTVSTIDFSYISLNDKLGSNPKVSISNTYTYNEETVEF